MPESSSSLSETRPDHSVVEQRQTDDYFQSNNEVRNSASTERYGDQSKNHADEKFETSEKTSISREFDSGSVKRERGNGELTREPRTEPDKSCFIGGLEMSQEVHFVTGSSYDGSWDALGMAGVGKYVLPNGTIYEGELRDGMFHGHGSLYWSENQRLDVVHLRGELIEHEYSFRDGPIYDEENWSYCKFPDRRFHESIKKGLRPGGRTFKTARQSATILPAGCYDTGDGIFDPKTQRITSYTDSKKLLRVPTGDEYDWIVTKCRKSWTAPTGYRPDLNENWSENPPKLPYNLPMSCDSPDHWWKRPEVCACGQIVIIGKPCDCASDDVSSGEYEISERTLSEELSSGNRESNGVFSGEASSTENIPAFANIERSSRGRVEKRHVSKKMYEAESAKVFHTDVDSTSNIRGDLCGDSFSGEFSKQFRGTQKASSEKLRRKIWEKNEGLEEPTGTRILPKRAKRSIEIGESLEDFAKVDIGRMAPENIGRKEDKELTDFKRDVSDVESEGKRPENAALDGVMANYVLEASDEKRNRENIQLVKDVIEEETLRDPDEQSQQQSEMEKRNVNLSEHEDYTADSIPREKVTGEPETRNDRTPETKLSQENVSEKHLDHESIEPGTIEKESQHVFRQDNSNDDSDEIVEHPTVVYTDNSADKAPAKSSSTHGRSLENLDTMSRNENSSGFPLEFVQGNESTSEFAKKSDTSARSISKKASEHIISNAAVPNPIDNEKSNHSLGENAPEAITRNGSEKRQESLTERKTEIAHPRNVEKRQPKGESLLEFVQVDKSMSEAEKEVATSAHPRSDITKERSFTSTISKEGLQISSVKPGNESIVAANLTDDGKSISVIASVKWENLERAVTSEDDVTSLDKVHPSLATLVSTKQEPSEGKDIVEIYRKCPNKEKPENVPMNTNVWRLSSAKQNYGPKTKIESLLFHPALTAPRSDNVKYVRKPCDYRVCEKMTPEVRTTASRSEKEHPPKVPSKSFRSSGRRNSNRDK